MIYISYEMIKTDERYSFLINPVPVINDHSLEFIFRLELGLYKTRLIYRV